MKKTNRVFTNVAIPMHATDIARKAVNEWAAEKLSEVHRRAHRCLWESLMSNVARNYANAKELAEILSSGLMLGYHIQIEQDEICIMRDEFDNDPELNYEAEVLEVLRPFFTEESYIEINGLIVIGKPRVISARRIDSTFISLICLTRTL